MSKLKSRAKQFKELDEHIAKDYDPEADAQVSEQGSGSEASEDENAGTEHYVSVGKSKLRQKDGVSLGPQYQGTRVSRDALEQESGEDEDEEEGSDEEEDYADPETANLELDTAEAASDSEISSDNALGDSDEERFKDFAFRGSSKPKKSLSKDKKQRATAADFMSSSDEGGANVDDEDDDMSGVELDDGTEEDEDMDDGLDALVNGGDSDDEEEGEDDDEEDEEDEDSDAEEEDDDSESDDDEGTKKKKEQSAKPALAAFSNRADVDKGLAIRQQRKAYDGLLNLRIRLQKALIAANTFDALEDSPEPESEPYEAAEEAAIKLLNTISSLRDNFGSRAGDKRKRELQATMSAEDIWTQMQEEEERSIKFREDRLEKWSRKVQSVNVTNTSLGSRNKTLINALQEQLNNPENRLAKRSRVPRSCAPAQAAKGVTDDDVYDDADFYQQLLKELVDQRTVDGSSNQAGAVPTVVMTASKDAKMRKNVDRKASKGRKMRFTVHEKLQNFMAPEDRRAWEQDAINRFFGTLFGRKMELNEDDSDDDMEVDAEEAGLRLFRN